MGMSGHATVRAPITAWAIDTVAFGTFMLSQDTCESRHVKSAAMTWDDATSVGRTFWSH